MLESPMPQEEIPLNDLYKGDDARMRFWDIYKSGRVARDGTGKNDPRVVYLQTCMDSKLMPRAAHIIRDAPPTEFCIPGVGLTPQFVEAVSKALSLMPVAIEAVDFSNNALSLQSANKLLASLEKHFESLARINFAENKLGSKFCTDLTNALDRYNRLQELDISGNPITDLKAIDLFSALSRLNLKVLKVSNCGLCKSSNGPAMAESLGSYIKYSVVLKKLDLSWNHFEGPSTKPVILGISNNDSLKYIDFSHNLLGAGEHPVINDFSEILTSNEKLVSLNLSYNMINTKSIYVMSYYIKNTKLKHLNLEGNQFSEGALRSLLQAQESGALQEIQAPHHLNPCSSRIIFDPSKQFSYTLDLADSYNRVMLIRLLEHNNGDLGSFEDVRYNGKAYLLNSLPDSEGRYDIPYEGTLTFHYNPSSSLFLQTTFTSKPLSESALQKYAIMLAKEKSMGGDGVLRVISALTRKHELFVSQAIAILSVLKVSSWEFESSLEYIIPRLRDKHNLDVLFTQYPNRVFRNLDAVLGPSYLFHTINTIGHYILDLARSDHFNIIETLIELNEEYKITMENKKDKNYYGNFSLFRNEKLNDISFTVTYDWIVPHTGKLEFDFSLYSRHSNTHTSDEAIDSIIDMLKLSQATAEEKVKAFKLISAYLNITTDQLKRIIKEVSSEVAWVRDATITGLGICRDTQNLYLIKEFMHELNKPFLQDQIVTRVGHLQLFSPLHPDGLYKLDLEIYEERVLGEILLKLALKEGIASNCTINFNRGELELTEEFVKHLPKEGMLDMVYFAGEENLEYRTELAKEYLDLTY